MSVRVDARVMPNLDAFDEEFGRERLDIDPPSKTGFRISTVIGLALAAGIISALALGWPNPSGTPRPEPEPASSQGERPDAAANTPERVGGHEEKSSGCRRRRHICKTADVVSR